MADDLNDLGSFSLFSLEPNWATTPNFNIELARLLQRFRGTSHNLISYLDDAPERLNLTFTALTRSEVYDLIDFFNNRQGILGRFWIKATRQEFILKEDAGSGAAALLVYRNGAVNQYQGYERIFIVMNDGDLLTHHITGVVEDVSNDRYSLNLATPTDRDITTTNHIIIGRLLLARFTEDKLIMDFQNDQVAEVSFSIVELVTEYDEI